MFWYTTIICSCLVTLSLQDICDNKPKCDDKVLQCIKEENGGSYPIHAWTGLNILWNRDYSIVWYSEPLVKQLGFTCITTKFGFTGATDSYLNGCQKLKEVKFSTKLSMTNKTFSINDYEGINMKAYAVYYKKYCLALYVCSPYGAAGPHVTIYCPTTMLGRPEVSAEVEEAKARLTKCGINDGVATCQSKTVCP